MAAYAALVSLKNIIDQIENHPSPPISLDKQQLESLTEKITFLQGFLEDYNSPFDYSDDVDPLETRIADATHHAEDVIESFIFDNIQLAAATPRDVDDDDDDDDDDDVEEEEEEEEDEDDEDDDDDGHYDYYDDDIDVDVDDERTSCIHFYQDVQEVIEEMDLIKREVIGKYRGKIALKSQLQRNVSDAGLRSTSNEMVGFDDVLLQLLERLTGGNLNRQIIPIVGMGGIGKTTLARNAFQHPLIKEHFDICLWATISQDCDIGESLSEIFSQIRVDVSNKSEREIGEQLHKHLAGRRYLIIMDDMWSIEVWDKMKFFLPDYKNGSRILVTSRLSNLAVDLTDRNSLLEMRFLDEVSSWNLFSKTVFGEESFPPNLEKIGNKIVGNCNGLPLSIVVIGGLMAKSQHKEEYWEHIEENMSSIVNLENDEYCLRILKMSYNHLPAHLKPCFLYMGVFEEDSAIRVSKLIQLWVSEGFLKPIDNKSLEIVAKEYLNELVDRNLILVDELGSTGNMKYCKMHDLVRDLSLKEVQKQWFYCVISHNTPRGINGECCFVIPRSTPAKKSTLEKAQPRSLVYHNIRVGLLHVRLMRTLYNRYRTRSLENVFQMVNSRYIHVQARRNSDFPSSISLVWNLHVLIVNYKASVGSTHGTHGTLLAPVEIWKMHRLKHVVFSGRGLYLPHPPSSGDDIVVMENLETLKGVLNLNLNEEVVRRIPNLKKLCITYKKLSEGVDPLSYLQFLSKLESFRVMTQINGDGEFLHNINFPHSLKKLTLILASRPRFALEDMLLKIGSLSLLEKLVIERGCFKTRRLETIEGQFPCLKSLRLINCDDLENWRMSKSSHFPLLQKLCLESLEGAELEIPSEIGEISTLKSIELRDCSESVVMSAKRILEEQEDLFGDQLDLQVRCWENWKSGGLQYLATPNFHFL